MAEALESDVKKILALFERLAKRDAIYDLHCSLSLTEPNVIDEYWRYNLSGLNQSFQALADQSQTLSKEQQEVIAGALEESANLSLIKDTKPVTSLYGLLTELQAHLKEQLPEMSDKNELWEGLQSLIEWAQENEKANNKESELDSGAEQPDWYAFADLLHALPEVEDQPSNYRESILEACSKSFYCAAVLMTNLSHYDEVLESDIDSAVLTALDERYAHCFQNFIVPLYNVMKAGTFTKAVQQIYFSPQSKLKSHAAEFYGAVKTPKATLSFLKKSFFIDGEIDLETRIKFESFHIFLSELATKEITLWQNKQANCVDHDREKLLETWGEEELAGYGTLMKKLDYVHRLYQIASQGMLDSFGQSEKILCPEVL
ncbi:MAG: hypothetical protein P1V97_34335 [Planctomycetota bacterium]|nr:hypothetical protein [Planctomycetota bacterium]